MLVFILLAILGVLGYFSWKEYVSHGNKYLLKPVTILSKGDTIKFEMGDILDTSDVINHILEVSHDLPQPVFE